MALNQSLPGLDQDELFNNAFNWEPKYNNRFIMLIDGPNGNIPSYLIKTASKPSMTNGEITLDMINIDRKVKGKSRWNDITITLYDPIVPSGAQSVMQWVRNHHESLTGRDGYSTDYKQDLTFHSLSATGEKIEEWTIRGAFILDSTFGDMDWSQEGATEISLTLKYDFAILQY